MVAGVLGGVTGSLALPGTVFDTGTVPAVTREAVRLDADSALTALYTAHYRPLVRLAALLLDDVGTSEEVVQDAYVKMHGAWGRVRDPEAAVGYLRTTVVNLARSRMRHSSMRLVRSTLGSEESDAVFGTLPSTHGAPEHIEAAILVQEVLAHLTAEERWLCSRKQLGFSSREIAREQDTSVARVNTLFYRVKRKIRNALSGARAGAGLSTTAQPTKTRTA